LGLVIEIIEPCGFPFSRHALKRAGLDYIDKATVAHHASFDAFTAARRGRLVLLTTAAPTSYLDCRYRAEDVLMVGAESRGVPKLVQEAADERVRIPMIAGMRSINVALAAAMVLGEALRQTRGFPA
jgi:tRNA (cytidine/uridine-2'-O-)-methyltransferase